MAAGEDAAASRLGALPVIELPGGLRVHAARTARTRRRGLAGLAGLPAGHGLWIAPCRSVHTFGMRFPLDLVWLDRHEQVLRVDREVDRRRLCTRLRARSVIEVGAGEGDGLAAAWPGRPLS